MCPVPHKVSAMSLAEGISFYVFIFLQGLLQGPAKQMKSFLTVEKLQFGLFKSKISQGLKTGHGGPGKCLQAGCF